VLQCGIQAALWCLLWADRSYANIARGRKALPSAKVHEIGHAMVNAEVQEHASALRSANPSRSRYRVINFAKGSGHNPDRCIASFGSLEACW
jgi:hypothetical protein